MATPFERAILVTDIPYITDDVDQLKDKVERYFGRRDCGGGDIETVICPVAGAMNKAIVVFESNEDATPETVIQHGCHTFEEETINVKLLPPVCTQIEAELHPYYWDISPQEKASELIDTLKTEHGDANVFGGKYNVDKLRASIDDLQTVEEKVSEIAGIELPVRAAASVVISDVLDRSIEVSNIPFVTDDVNTLKTYLRDTIDQSLTGKVENVITPIKGNMQRAIVVFESTKDKGTYVELRNHPFKDEELTIDVLPKVFRKATATLEKFYMNLIPRAKKTSINAKLTENYGSAVSLTGNEITGPFEELMPATNMLITEIGFPPMPISIKKSHIAGEKQARAASIVETEESTNIDYPDNDKNGDYRNEDDSEISNDWVNVSLDGSGELKDNEIPNDGSNHKDNLETRNPVVGDGNRDTHERIVDMNNSGIDQALSLDKQLQLAEQTPAVAIEAAVANKQHETPSEDTSNDNLNTEQGPPEAAFGSHLKTHESRCGSNPCEEGNAHNLQDNENDDEDGLPGQQTRYNEPDKKSAGTSDENTNSRIFQRTLAPTFDNAQSTTATTDEMTTNATQGETNANTSDRESDNREINKLGNCHTTNTTAGHFAKEEPAESDIKPSVKTDNISSQTSSDIDTCDTLAETGRSQASNRSTLSNSKSSDTIRESHSQDIHDETEPTKGDQESERMNNEGTAIAADDISTAASTGTDINLSDKLHTSSTQTDNTDELKGISGSGKSPNKDLTAQEHDNINSKSLNMTMESHPENSIAATTTMATDKDFTSNFEQGFKQNSLDSTKIANQISKEGLMEKTTRFSDITDNQLIHAHQDNDVANLCEIDANDKSQENSMTIQVEGVIKSEQKNTTLDTVSDETQPDNLKESSASDLTTSGKQENMHFSKRKRHASTEELTDTNNKTASTANKSSAETNSTATCVSNEALDKAMGNTSERTKLINRDINEQVYDVKSEDRKSSEGAGYNPEVVITTSSVGQSDKTYWASKQGAAHLKTPGKPKFSESQNVNGELLSKGQEPNNVSKVSISESANLNMVSSVEEVITDYISVDAITYRYLRKTVPEKLHQISRKFNVTLEVETPALQRPTEQIILFKPRGTAKKYSLQDQIDAREAFTSLYQAVFFSVKRVSLNCNAVPAQKAASAQHETEKKMIDVVILKDKQEYVFCGAEIQVNRAVEYFREKAGIPPKSRKLKQEGSPSFEDYSNQNYNDESRSAAEEHNERVEAETVPGSFPSVFSTKEGLEIIVLLKDITKQHVDIIVNAANGQLDHSGGVALAISRAAGKQLQWDCNKIMWGRQPLPTGHCIETRGYKLPCQYVIHAVGPIYQKQGNPNTFFAELETTFRNVLQLAEEKHAQTIAIPLISSGNYGGPKEICTNALSTTLYAFSSSRQKRSLRQVFLVNIDQGATVALQSNLSGVFPTRSETNGTKIGLPPDVNQQRTNQSTKFKTSEGIEVAVVQGDITKGSVEVIVNAANGNLLHGSGVAGAIARAAGRRMQNESNQIIAQRRRPLDVGECVATEGYNLKCKIIHAVGPIYKKCQSDKEFFDLLKKTFLEAIRHANLPIEAKQIAIPLISSGIYGGPKSLCAKALAEAVKEFSRTERNLVIKRIYLVNIDDETTDAVRNAFQASFSPESSYESSKSGDIPVEATKSEGNGKVLDGFQVNSNRGIVLNVLHGNIQNEDVDVIVNPTSPTLSNNGGVARAISDAAGYKLQQHCNYVFKEERKSITLDAGETVVTNGFDLSCKYIIHTFCPPFASNPSSFSQSLQQTFLSCMKLADSTLQEKTVAFPLIGSSEGPKETCAKAFAEAILELDKSAAKINLARITLVTNDNDSCSVVEKTLAAYFSPPQIADADKRQSDPLNETVFRTEEHMELRVRNEDIAKQSTDVIVNSTDNKLTNSSDTSKRLCETAGPGLQKECKGVIKKRKSVTPGSFISTEGYQLPCKHVVHISTPIRGDRSDQDLTTILTRTYISSFLFAQTTLQAKSIAIPLIGLEEESPEFCAEVLATSLKQFSHQTKSNATNMTIYVVNMAIAATSATKTAFTGHFRRESLAEGFEYTQSSTDNRAAGGMTTASEVITVQPSKSQTGYRSEDGKHKRNIWQQQTRVRDANIAIGGMTSPSATANYRQGSYAEALKGNASSGKGPFSVNPPLTNSVCRICKNQNEKVHILEGCQHRFCLACITDKITPESTCQECGALYAIVMENDLGGKMKYYRQDNMNIEGALQKGVIIMEFNFATGIQNNSHPCPGKKFFGMTIVAYLPDTNEGREVLFLLRTAFLNGHLFKISNQHGHQRVILGDIPLKGNTSGGIPKNGYPDPGYLSKVKEKLKKKGILPAAGEDGGTSIY